MKRWLLEILACPDCGKYPLDLIEKEANTQGVISGILRCSCQSTYPIINSIPRFLPNYRLDTLAMKVDYDEDTKKKFEFQWQKWGRDEVIFGKSESECFNFFDRFSGSAVSRDFLKGKLVLDAGCGHGRFTQIFAKMGAQSVGVGVGDGVEIAQWRTKGMDNVNIVQADIMKMPFKKGVFDYLWSNGVIHHTPDTFKAFTRLVNVVKESGYLDIWVYPKGGLLWETSQRAIRFFTIRLNPKLLSILCYLPAPLLAIVPTYSKTRFPKNSWRECAQVIYDWYSPKYQWHHAIEEVVGWYQREGFEDIEALEVPVAVSGKKAKKVRIDG